MLSSDKFIFLLGVLVNSGLVEFCSQTLWILPVNLIGMEEENSGTMIKLTSSNYLIWKSRIEYLLYCKDAYEPVISVKQGETIDFDGPTSNYKTVSLITQGVDDSVFHHVSGRI